MKTYLVGSGDSQFSDEDFVLVEADNGSAAIDSYARRVGIADPQFLDYIYDRAPNMSFADSFWFRTEEEQAALSADGSLLATEEEFSNRVREFFDVHVEFADMYLSYFLSDEDNPPRPQFPEDMLVYMWKDPEWMDVCAFNLADLRRIHLQQSFDDSIG